MSFTNPLNTERLQKSIERDINACKKLIDLLNQEHSALIARNTEILEGIINEKSALLNQLNQSAITRSQWVNHYKSITDSAEQSDVSSFTALAEKTGLKVKWIELQMLVKQCKTANEINGKAMSRSQVTNEKLLNILRGQHNAPHLYDGKGTKGKRALGNTLGQA